MALKSKVFTLCSFSFKWGVYLKFYLGKTDFSLYFPIRWLFWMGSHWCHWTVKSSLCRPSVLKFTLWSGRFDWGVHHQFYPGESDNLSSRMFRCAHQKGLFTSHKTNKWALIGVIEQWRVSKFTLWSGRFDWGGSIISFTWVNLTICAPMHLGMLIKKVFLLCERPIKWIGSFFILKDLPTNSNTGPCTP